MLYAERHRPRGVGLAGAVHRTWAVAEKNDWQFSNPRIDTDDTTGLVPTIDAELVCCAENLKTRWECRPVISSGRDWRRLVGP